MSIRCFYRESGEVVLIQSNGYEFALDLPSIVISDTEFDFSAPHDDVMHYVDQGQLIRSEPRPNEFNEWSWITKEWIPSIDSAKSKKKDEVERERERRNQLPIAYAGAVFDADTTAMRNISGWQVQLAAGATLPTGFAWRDHYNINHPADADFVNGLGAAITTRGTQLYVAAWQHKANLDALTTVEEVIAYDLAQGWPE